MKLTVNDVNSELARLRNMPYGVARSETVRQLVERVETEGPREALAFGLFSLIESYAFTPSEAERAIVPFTKLQRLWDSHPELFDEYDRHSFFWSFKWMVSDLQDYPTVPRDQIERTLDDMDSRYAQSGNGMSGVLHQRFQWAYTTGANDTEEWYRRWSTEPRDDYSQCDACQPSEQGAYLIATGRVAEGVRTIEKALADHVSCGTEPGDMLSELALAYLKLGRDADAVSAHRRAMAELGSEQHGIDMSGTTARCVQFLATTRNIDAMKRLLVRNQHLLQDATKSPYKAWSIARDLGSATHIARELGHGDDPLVLTVKVSTVSELDEWLHDRARTIAALFDDRNGTTRVSDQTTLAWQARPLAHHVELSSPLSSTTSDEQQDMAESVKSVSPRDVLADARHQAATNPELAASRLTEAADALVADGDLASAAKALGAAGFAEQRLHVSPESTLSAFERAISLARSAGSTPADFAPWIRGAAQAHAELSEFESAQQILQQALTDLGSFLREYPQQRTRSALIEEANLVDALGRIYAAAGDNAQASHCMSGAAQRYAELGAFNDAAYSFELLGQLRIAERAAADDIVWAFESAIGAFDRANRLPEQMRVADHLIEFLRACGREEAAQEVAESLSRLRP